MRVFRIFCRVGDVHTSFIMRHIVASAAYEAAELLLAPDAKAYGIEEVSHAEAYKPTSESRKRLQKMINRLALAPVRCCRSLHTCVFCANSITYGDEYRDRGYGARAHETCFKAVAREYKP